MFELYVFLTRRISHFMLYITKYSQDRFMKHKELETEQMGLYFILYVIL